MCSSQLTELAIAGTAWLARSLVLTPNFVPRCTPPARPRQCWHLIHGCPPTSTWPVPQMSCWALSSFTPFSRRLMETCIAWCAAAAESLSPRLLRFSDRWLVRWHTATSTGLSCATSSYVALSSATVRGECDPRDTLERWAMVGKLRSRRTE